MAEMRIIHCVVLFSVLAISCGLPTAANRRIRRLIGDPDAVNDSTGKAARRHHGQHVGDDDGEIQASRLDQLANRSTSRTVDDVDDSEMGEFLWRKIEHRVLHHLRRTEEKLMEHVEDKTSGLNQSITINYLYKVYHYLIEEVEIGKRIGEMRAGEIEKVRKIAVEQGKKIVALENSVLSLRRLLDNVTESLRSMDASRQPEGVQKDAMTSTVSPSTTAFRIRPQLPADCHEVYQLGGMKYDGDYFIKINPYLSDQPFEVCCRMVNNAGWTVIQRRRDGSVDFYQNWEEYKGGFGDPRGEFWIGNDHIYELTNQDDYMLRIEMVDFDGRHHFAEYDHFRILDEAHDYRIHVHGYHGDAGDSLTPAWSNHDGQAFSTYDRDNDGRFYDNCAERFHGAWWFRSCFESHLNGFYYKHGEHNDYFKQNGIQWNTVGHHYSLKSVVMMIKPNKQLVHTKEDENIQLSNDIQ